VPGVLLLANKPGVSAIRLRFATVAAAKINQGLCGWTKPSRLTLIIFVTFLGALLCLPILAVLFLSSCPRS
jgi:hypothetical protein